MGCKVRGMPPAVCTSEHCNLLQDRKSAQVILRGLGLTGFRVQGVLGFFGFRGLGFYGVQGLGFRKSLS